MAISGLHIGLAGSSFFLLGWLLLAPFCRRINARDIATIIAVVAATAYAQLSGFAVPAQRALLMAFVLAIGIAMRRKLAVSALLAIPAMVIFLGNPLAILAPGFMLSFAAVAIIFLCLKVFVQNENNRTSGFPGAAWKESVRLMHIQFALLAGLFPLTVFAFDRFALSAPIVNIVALPLFNLVTVPSCLFGMLLDGPFEAIGDVLLTWSHRSITWLLELVGAVAEQSRFQYEVARLDGPMMAVAVLPLLHVILPRGWPGRRIAIIAGVAVVLYAPPSPRPGCLEYTVLDTGQGLAIVVQTNQHTMLFDTGAKYRGGGDMAQVAVLPFLRRKGLHKIDKMVVSHGDIDHAGGLQSVTANMSVREILSGERLELSSLATRPCRTGQKWDWDGIGFAILHPQNRAAWSGNNLSCVLLVSAGERRLLLTGDIETSVESLLTYRAVLPVVDTVVVPHHGSKTSSSPAFVAALRPNLAIVAAGIDNRWKMPREDVVRRWRDAGATVLNTAVSGAVSQRLCTGQPAPPASRERVISMRYWHDPPAEDS
jgi:competence protein ComEC